MQYDELDDDFDSFAVANDVEPYAYCFMGCLRPIWPHQMVLMSRGKHRGVCRVCGAVYRVREGRLVMEGFKVLGA